MVNRGVVTASLCVAGGRGARFVTLAFAEVPPMPVGLDVHAANRAATDRIRSIAVHLTDADLDRRVGDHWTPGVVFAHLAFWDRRVQLTLDATEAAGRVVIVDVDIAANDISLPLWLL